MKQILPNKPNNIHSIRLGVISLLLLAMIYALAGIAAADKDRIVKANFIKSFEAHNIYPNGYHVNGVKVNSVKLDSIMPDEFKDLLHPEIVWKIYGLESTWGKNDSCKEKGKFNGFGFGQSTFSRDCFDSLAEVAKKVDKWLDNQLKSTQQKVLAETLCYYNQGIKETDCKYYQNYLTLK